MQGVDDKAVALLSICNELRIDPKETMFVGNDINDIPAFQMAGIPVAVFDAYPEIIPFVIYQTKKPGGFGAVREICDLVYNVKKSHEG